MKLDSQTRRDIQQIPRNFVRKLKKLDDIEENKKLMEDRMDECVNIATYLLKELPGYFKINKKDIPGLVSDLSKKIYEAVYIDLKEITPQ